MHKFAQFKKTHDLSVFLAKPVKKLQEHLETRFTLIWFKINRLNIMLNKTETKEFKNLSGHFLIKISLKLIQPIHQLAWLAYLDKADESSHCIKGIKTCNRSWKKIA